MHAVLTCTDPVEIDIQDHSSKYKVLYKVLKNTALCDLKLANRCWSLMVSLIYCRVATHRASHWCSLQGNELSEGAQPVTIITVIYRLMKPHQISYNLINMRLNSWKGRYIYIERERGRRREINIYIYKIYWYILYIYSLLYIPRLWCCVVLRPWTQPMCSAPCIRSRCAGLCRTSDGLVAEVSHFFHSPVWAQSVI